MELRGTEVKSVREGRINIKDSWCSFKNGEVFVNNVHISAYENGNRFNTDCLRIRKLLIHKNQIIKLYDQYKRSGFSVVVLSAYIDKKWIKFEIALCKGKKIYDKRATKAKMESERNIQRAIRKKLKS